MIEGSLGLIVEGLVSILLVATIFYCISVNRKLERLRHEQKGMHNFIRELSLATNSADKAIQGLRLTVQDSGAELATQIDKGRNMSRTLKGEIESAEQTLNKLVVLASSAGNSLNEQAVAPPATMEPLGISQSRSLKELRNSMLGFEDLERESDQNSFNVSDDLSMAAKGVAR